MFLIKVTICRLQTANCRLSTANCELPTTDCRLPTADCRLPTADCRLPTADCELPTPIHHPSSKKPSQFLFLLLWLTTLGTSAQNPYIQHYTTYDGLPTNTVYYIYQDSKKFIWFATDAGVVRYDGTTFSNFRKSDGLNSNEVIRIKEDSFGRIWFFNLNGRLNFFYQNKIFNKTNASFLDSINNKNFFIDFYQDQDRTIYFYNSWFEIYSVDPHNNVKKYGTDEKTVRDQINFKCVGDLGLRYLNKNSMGEFICWTRCEVFKLKTFFKKPVKLFDSLPICAVYPGRDRSVYLFAYHNGVFKIDDKFQVERAIKPFKMPFAYSGIKSILEDNSGFLWIVTYDLGVFCLRNNTVVYHFDIKEGQAILLDNENNIWISSMKDGVYKISPYLNYHKHFENDLFQNTGITAMDAKPGMGLWFTNGKLVYLFKNNNFYTLNFQNENYPFTQVFQLKNNTLILSGNGSLKYAFKGISMDHSMKKIVYKTLIKSHLPANKVSINIKEDKFNTFGNRIVIIYDFPKYFQNFKEIKIGEHINNTFYDLNDALIINANKNYLYRDEKLIPCKELSYFDNKIITDHLILNDSVELYNIEGDSIYLYNRHNYFNLTAAFGSPIDHQIRKTAYEEPVLYLSTSRNIYKCDNPLDILKNKPVILQLVNINFRNIHDIVVKNDSVYIASDDGLTIIPEAMINKMPANIPIPYLKSVLVNDKEEDPTQQNLQLTGDNKITFQFGCINYSSTPVQYLYKLEGADTGWILAPSTNITYLNLRIGNYIFKLKVCKPSLQCSKPIEFKFRIRAHFWQHPLFLSVILIIFLILIFLTIINRKNSQMRRREIDHQLITLEQKALQSMMNPHFIFNSLGSIQNYLLQNKSGEAGLYLSQFARLIRQNINAINAASINLEEEIDRLKNYLDLEKLRMENKFDYDIEVDENVEADEIMIPSMIIQPFVENAIWHGIASLDDRGLIRITFRQQTEKSILIRIEDNGIGMKRSAEFSMKNQEHLNLGMEMIRRRLDLLEKKYHVDTCIKVSEANPDSQNPGTKVEMVVPVSTE